MNLKEELGKSTTRFLAIYLIFVLFALLVNLSMEMIIPTPEVKEPMNIVFFYTIFQFVGSLVFLLKDFESGKMGFLSLVAGFILEFTLMNPEWVKSIYSLSIGGDVIVAAIVSAFYWFIAWGGPSYFARHLKLSRRSS